MKRTLILLFIFMTGCSSRSWRDASRESTGIAKKAAEQKEDILQIYYARAFSWRGYFAIHPWVAWKKSEDTKYTVAHVTAWNHRRENTTISVSQDLPDRKWFDSEPTILFQIEGPTARRAITEVEQLIKDYPFKDGYRLWPGPNSNTFVSHLIRHIEALETELPPHAIGKDYFGPTQFFAKSPSGTGFQLSLWGALGITLGLQEGVEFNFLSLNFGLDLWPPAIKLPFIGRLGFADKKTPNTDSEQN